MSLEDSLVSSTARTLPLKVRSDLEVVKSRYLGRVYWVVKDPVGLRYFRFHEEEYALLKMLDGTRSLDKVKEEFESEFPPQKITLGEIQRFLGQLHQSGLIVSGLAGQGEQLRLRASKKKRAERMQKFTNVLAIKIAGFDPDALLTKTLPLVRWFYHPATQIAAVIFCLLAATLVIVEFETFRSKLPAFQTFFSPANIVLLSIVLGFTKILHEFGHGFTAKYFGGECHQMGIMFLVLTPCLYVDASDSWMLPNKWYRIAIASAGVWVECVLAALCTFIWWFSTPGVLHYLCLNIMFISSVSTVIFNINPLLRYDGYYIMSDWLEIPNLRQKSQTILTRTCGQIFLGIKPPDDPFLPKKNRLLFAIYAVAAFMYRWIVMASILFFLYHVFKPWGLQVIGQAIAAFSLFSLFIMPLVKVVKFFWIPGRIYQVKQKPFLISLAALALLVAGFFLVPIPYRVVVPTIVELDMNDAHTIFVPPTREAVLLKKVGAREGEVVRRGMILGYLESIPLEMELRELLGKHEELVQQLENTERQAHERPEAALQLGVLKESLAATAAMYQEKRKVYEALTLRAPNDGVVVSPPSRFPPPPRDDILPTWNGSPLRPENLGASLESGTVFCYVGNPAKMVCVAFVDQSKIAMIMPDQKAVIYLDSGLQKLIRSSVREVEKRKTDVVPTQMSTRGGGEVPTMSQPDGQETPQGAVFRVEVPLDNRDELFSSGMTGLVKIHVAPQTLAYRLFRWFQETFHFKL